MYLQISSRGAQVNFDLVIANELHNSVQQLEMRVGSIGRQTKRTRTLWMRIAGFQVNFHINTFLVNAKNTNIYMQRRN